MRNNNLEIKVKNSSFSLFRRFRRRKIFRKVLLCIAILVLAHSEEARRHIDGLKTQIMSLHVTTYAMLDKVRESFANFQYFFFKNVDKILFDLRSENLKLSLAIDQLKNLKSENENLRRLLALKQLEDHPLTVAKVIAVFANDFARSTTLDLGASKNVALNDIVMDDKGLIGRIIEVADDWSRALLITDVNSVVPVKINGVNAMLSGGNSNKLQITMVQEDVTFRDGDLVETSGYGNIFAEKIPIGKIKMDGGKAAVIPFVNFNSLGYVAIIKNNAPTNEHQIEK
ncbi:MAG: rod shape-determining protein MreC [Holosporaceae bacterium]|jgi:rod shape-determining protein MreC|nr:rod shape-determining protein MreC [Holosporaceae bacterium]